MTPILIDGRGLRKLGFLSMLTAIFVFSAGFLSGHEKALSFYQADSERELLALPEEAVSITSAVEPITPEIIVAGEDMDVDQPGLASKEVILPYTVKDITSEANNTDKPDLTVSADNLLAEKPLTIIQDAVIETSQAGDVDESVEVDAHETSENKIIDNTDMVQEYQAVMISSFSADELNKIKYSIQVGMYGSLINAEKMMETLQAKQLDSYVSNYTNKKNEVRYNVRFGYFTDKKTALSALKMYKSRLNGDGYLVKLSEKNLTEIARAADIDQPAVIEESSERLTPEIKSSDDIQDKTTPVDAVNTIDILTETDTEMLAKTRIETLTN